MPKLIQNITGSLVDNLKDTIHAIKFIESKFGYGDYFELGCYEAFLQDLRKVNISEDLNQTSDFGVANNRNETFKVIEISEYIASSTCVPPTTFNGAINTCGIGTAAFDLSATESDIAPFEYTTATFEWYEDIALTIPIVGTSSYTSPTTNVYVKVSNSGGCFNIATLGLNVDSGPTVFNGVDDESDTGGGQATFNLIIHQPAVAPFDYTTATFEWYEDAALTIPIGTPGTFLTVSTTVYVKVINPNSCYNIADLTLNVI